MNYNSYINGCKRGDFQWECIEYDDYGGVLREGVSYKGKKYGVTITKESVNEYLIQSDFNNEPYCIETYRSSRNNARKFAERIIINDVIGNIDENIKISEKEDNR